MPLCELKQLGYLLFSELAFRYTPRHVTCARAQLELQKRSLPALLDSCLAIRLSLFIRPRLFGAPSESPRTFARHRAKPNRNRVVVWSRFSWQGDGERYHL